MPKFDYIVGIDPDVEKNGFALLDVKAKSFLKIEALTFPLLMVWLGMVQNPQTIQVVVEASWLSTTNWHLKQWEQKQKAASKGYDVGRNHETGHKIVEMCRYYGFNVVEHIPLRKCWKGKDRKITHEELKQFANGLPSRTNQEERDAALLAWSFANLPIRLKA